MTYAYLMKVWDEVFLFSLPEENQKQLGEGVRKPPRLAARLAGGTWYRDLASLPKGLTLGGLEVNRTPF